jgi:hypothetical protein
MTKKQYEHESRLFDKILFSFYNILIEDQFGIYLLHKCMRITMNYLFIYFNISRFYLSQGQITKTSLIAFFKNK